MSRRLKIAAGALATLLALLLGYGISTDDLSGGDAKASDLVGTWLGPDGARISFAADGTFASQDYPVEVSPATGQPVRRASDSGAWDLAGTANSPGDQEIELTFLNPADGTRYGGRLRALGASASKGLSVFWSEDATTKIVFKHVGS
ncbi:hypothetical protein ACIRPK_22635 [Kitasatospora sp. NPDC101801]|uniref:hypothetical protein n=1 Tax=Kitasatospora sp. NPDC101801 TaxID=3364103 RepID=UPI0038241AB1